jgi:hypothetical protein
LSTFTSRDPPDDGIGMAARRMAGYFPAFAGVITMLR